MASNIDPNRELPTNRDLDVLASYFRHFADIHVAQTSPLYAALAHSVAKDRDLLALAAEATPGQPPANLLFASVQYLLRQADEGEPLKEFYSTLGGTRTFDANEIGALFSQFVWTHAEDVRLRLSTKITNTNEVGRCGVLIVGLVLAAQEAQAPLHMVEIGPSAGLNLVWDRFRYRHGSTEMGLEDAPFTIAPEVKGHMPPHLDGRMPNVASRRGIELNPVDLDDDETLAWQLALIFPEHVDRAIRITKAFEIAREVRPEIIVGNAVDLIDGVIADLPADGAVCVYHTQATYQIPKEGRAELSRKLADCSRQRPIWRVAIEWLGGGSRGKDCGHSSLGIARYRDGAYSYQHLAFCDPHGRWIEWGPTVAQESDLL